MSVALYSVRVGDASAPGQMAVTHGIFGSGGNLRTFARLLVERRPDFCLHLVDLREHGRSKGAPPPHTIAAAGADLAEWVRRQETAVRVLLGHSLGGKVVLAARSALGDDLTQTWVIDSSCSVRADAFDPPRDVPQVLAMLEAMPPRWTDRDAFVSAVVEAGHSRAIGQWLAMNLERRSEGFVLGIDLAAMRALLVDYYQVDAWEPMATPRGGQVHVVVAERSGAFDAAERERLDRLAAERAHVVAHRIDTGHWVHAEDPAGLAERVAAHLPRS